MERELIINMIGSGNVATHLAIALDGVGHRIGGICSRRKEHAEKLAELLGDSKHSDVFSCSVDDMQSLPIADVYVFAVKDAVLADLACDMADMLPKSVCHNALFVHTAGCMSIEVLTKHFREAAVMYPLQTFSKCASIDFRTIPLFVEGNSPWAEDAVGRLARSISSRVSFLNSFSRKKIHLAGVLVNNFTNHMCALAYDLLQQSGIDPDCLQPILEETIHKLQTMPPRLAQTGPAVRWDQNVMDMHRAMLKDQPALLQIYDAVSKSIHEYSQKQ